jgi:uncharacterized protein (DUF302 family)
MREPAWSLECSYCEDHVAFTALQSRGLLIAAFFLAVRPAAHAAETGLITKPSNHSVQETVERFVRGVKAKEANGWTVFSEIDHGAGASKNGLTLRPRIVILFGNPKLGTKPMEGAPTLAIDLPLKALVWQDDHGKVWLTYNTGDYLMTYVYPRHGIAMPAEVANGIERAVTRFADDATR